MYELVWLGNHLVPRWQAFAVIFGFLAFLIIIASIVLGVAIVTVQSVWEWIRAALFSGGNG